MSLRCPHVVGHEPAGEVVALGEGVTTRKVGDRVAYVDCNQHVADVK